MVRRLRWLRRLAGHHATPRQLLLTWLVRGEGTERLLAFSPGSADNDNIVVGGWFDGSVELDEGEGFFGNGVDGLILQLDLANP